MFVLLILIQHIHIYIYIYIYIYTHKPTGPKVADPRGALRRPPPKKRPGPSRSNMITTYHDPQHI